ncbi:MAG: RIP metalloprotease RseP [Chlorobi bacterium]|nr:RIP metalloprotease RseP [Chlorobiota bacterium]
MVFLIKTVQLLLSLSILVIIHEFGHFGFAKLFKTRVEKFYLFFDPWFSLFKFKKGETEYGIGWIPLGGYVKIAGMIDESMDKEQMALPPKPDEFRSKKAWQRLLIMLGGVIMNFVLAGVIYILVLFAWGEDYIPVENMKYGISVDSTGYELGFRNGDKIISINNKKFEKFSEIQKEILLSDNKTVQVERDGKIVEVKIKDSQIKSMIDSKHGFIGIRSEFEVADVLKNSNAEKAGIKIGDKLIAANDSSLKFFDEYVHFFKNHKNEEVELTVKRSDAQNKKISVMVDSLGHIGVRVNSLAGIETKHQDYSFFEAIPAGLSMGVEKVSDYLRQFKLIFNPETKAYNSLGSFGTIGSMFPAQWDWHSFWLLTAFLSIMLGVVNILPIPALDGGHVMFVLFEMITGRKPSDKFMEYAQIGGFVILMSLMLFALKNDIVRFFF